MRRAIISPPTPLTSTALLEPSRFLTRLQPPTCIVPSHMEGDLLNLSSLEDPRIKCRRPCHYREPDAESTEPALSCARAMTARRHPCLESRHHIESQRSESSCRP
jgi:hypothetical protein